MNLLFAAAILAQATFAPAEGPEPPAAKAHVANAHGIAGKDLAPIADGYLCRAPSSGNTYLAPIVFDPAIIAGKAFDNLFYIGKKSVGAWALVHGFAMLLLDGRLDPVLGRLPPGTDATDLLTAVLEAGPPAGPPGDG